MTSSPASAQPTSGATPTSWLATAPVPEFAPLTADADADVVIVGAGIAGLTTAYLLAREGRSVVVLDDGPVGGGESGRTTAHLSNALDDRYYALEGLFGEKGARLAAEAHGAAIDRIEQITKAENIACDFRRLDGYLFVGEGCAEKELEEELNAAQRAGLRGLRIQSESGQAGVRWPGPCLIFPHQGQFHITQYLGGLAQAITRYGGRIHGHSHVEEILRGDAADDTRVTLSGGPAVCARHVVVATNVPFNDFVVMHTKQAPYRTYVVALRVGRGTIAPGLYWDTADPYHYVRLQPTDGEGGDDLLIVGGEDHKVGQHPHEPAEYHGRLEAWARQNFDGLGEVAYAWSGQVLEPVDSLGYAGRNPLDAANVYLITGDSGHGLTHATLGALIITDLICGRPNPWADLFDPGRVTLRPASIKEFVKENANVAAEYTDLLTGGDVADPREILPGTGAVLRRGLTKVAAYRAPDGQLHECSAICPHLGCVVHWNNLEKSWDCPCHGSRFDPLGKLLNGPANSGLAAVD